MVLMQIKTVANDRRAQHEGDLVAIGLPRVESGYAPLASCTAEATSPLTVTTVLELDAEVGGIAFDKAGVDTAFTEFGIGHHLLVEWHGRVYPPMRNSSSARRIRRMASARVSPHTTSLAINGS